MIKITSKIALAIYAVAILGIVSAQPMVPSGGTTLNIPAPAVDWWARVASAIAVFVSIAAFVWGRVDKSRERHEAKEAKDPSVDAVLEQTVSEHTWVLRMRILNRGDFTIALNRIEVPSGFKLSTGRGSPPATSEAFEGYRAGPGQLVSVDAQIYRCDEKKPSIRIVVQMSEFRPKARKLEKIITRDL